VEQCELLYENCYAIVDGKVSPKLYADKREEESDMNTHQAFTKRFSVRPYVNGDANVFVVALASIVARITREKMMKDVHELHPNYMFDENNGYGTKDHIDALHRLGSIEGVHRLSFKQVAGR
jgi:ribonuclease HII